MIKFALILTLAGLSGPSAPTVAVPEKKLTAEFPQIVQEVQLTEKPVEEEEGAVKTVIERSTEEIVKEYFADIPILVEVARCESAFRHTNSQGQILRGLKNRQDIGVMQINERFHLHKSLTLETDIYDIMGNLEYARYLYQKKGLEPWRASEKCWSRQA